MSRHLAAVGDPAPPSTKRGRRQSLVDPAAGPVARFAHELVTLKLSAGDPSYDRMRQHLGAQASKSALSAAARGEDLPSWETTWEFVRCLAPDGSDLHCWQVEWRTRWEAAQETPGEAPSIVLPAVVVRSRKRRRTLIAAGLGAAVGAGVLGGWVLAGQSGDAAPERLPIPGDAVLLASETVPDGTEVVTGERFVKAWEYRNTGKVTWKGRYFQRQPDSQGDCRSTGRIPVPTARPGESVRISLDVIAPAAPGACTVYWKMVDEGGRPFFPAKRPPFYQVTVRPR